MPLRVINVAVSVSVNEATTSATFHATSEPRRAWTIAEWRNAVAVNHGRRATFSTGSQAQ